MVIKPFKQSHPIVLLVYFLSIITLMVIQSHYLVIIAGFISSLYLFDQVDRQSFFKMIKYYIGLLILITITNPLFVSEGYDILYQNDLFVITKQALVYGFIFGLLIITLLTIFKVMKYYLTDSHVIYLFGSILPTLGLVISMSLNLIERLKLQYQKIKEANNLLPSKNKIKKQLDMLLILVAYAFESSLDMVNSMNSRGYGRKHRSSFHLYQFRKDDLLKIVIIFILDLICFVGYFNFYRDFYYYPIVMSYHFKWLDLVFMICFGSLIILPLLFKGEKRDVSNKKS
ncbi:MAG: energy-coupling factor transporter transmembrane component T [Thomasclavelia sp.]